MASGTALVSGTKAFSNADEPAPFGLHPATDRQTVKSRYKYLKFFILNDTVQIIYLLSDAAPAGRKTGYNASVRKGVPDFKKDLSFECLHLLPGKYRELLV